MRAPWALAVAVVGLVGCQSQAAHLDPLLTSLEATAPPSLRARARESMRGRTIDPALEAALAQSADPAERRAARLLAALDTPAPVREDPAPMPVMGRQVPTLKIETPLPDTTSTPTRARTPKPTSKNAAPQSPPPPAPRATLERVGFAATKKGASLSLRGSGGLVVGIASQPSSGIVRLVMDADASTQALRARPGVEGARVTGVRRTGKSVFVTVALDPGWSLRGIVRTRGGARVELNRPA